MAPKRRSDQVGRRRTHNEPPTLENEVIVEDVPQNEEGSSSGSGHLGANASGQEHPHGNVAALSVDYAAIAAIVAQAFQQAAQQWQPNVIVQGPPLPPTMGTKIHFKAMKDADIPKFEGGPDPILAKKWIGEVERTFRVLEVPEEVRTKVIVPFLVGEAADWWEGVEPVLKVGDQPIMWTQFKEVFLDNFFPPYFRSQKIEEFYKLRQTSGMSVVDYAHMFQTLGRFVPTVMKDEVVSMYLFKKGLLSEIQSGIVLSQPQTFKAMYNVAVLIEADMKHKVREESNKRMRFTASPVQGNWVTQPFMLGQSRQGPPIRRGPPFKQGQSSTSRLFQPGDGSQGYQLAPVIRGILKCSHCHRRHTGECRFKTGACFNCGQLGHVVRNCPMAAAIKGQISNPPAKSADERKRKQTTGICFDPVRGGWVRRLGDRFSD